MAFLAAIPVGLPLIAEGVQAPRVSAGPYFLKDWVQSRTALAVRYPFWNDAKEPWKSMQRPALSQSPYRVGSGPSRPPISRGNVGWSGRGGAADTAADSGAAGVGFVTGCTSCIGFMISRRVCQIGPMLTTAGLG